MCNVTKFVYPPLSDYPGIHPVAFSFSSTNKWLATVIDDSGNLGIQEFKPLSKVTSTTFTISSQLNIEFSFTTTSDLTPKVTLTVNTNNQYPMTGMIAIPFNDFTGSQLSTNQSFAQYCCGTNVINQGSCPGNIFSYTNTVFANDVPFINLTNFLNASSVWILTVPSNSVNPEILHTGLNSTTWTSDSSGMMYKVNVNLVDPSPNSGLPVQNITLSRVNSTLQSISYGNPIQSEIDFDQSSIPPSFKTEYCSSTTPTTGLPWWVWVIIVVVVLIIIVIIILKIIKVI